MNRLALFDLDGTLVRENTAALFMRHEYTTGRATRMQLLRVAWWHARYSLGYLDAQHMATRALRWYAGREESDLQGAIAEWFVRSVVPHIGHAARSAVQRHQEIGDSVVLLSASSPYVANLVARELDIPHVLCSQLEVVEGCLSGRLLGPLCYGVGKVHAVQSWLRGGQRPERLADAAAYCDSITDLPLLDAVAKPVAVNPDRRLRRAALRNGWRIEHW